MKREYANNDITVVWDARRCVHSAKCLRGLPQVFDLRRRPWITMTGADSASIVATVRTCPSGALSIKNKQENTVSEASVKVTAVPNGPLLINGTCVIVDEQGKETIKNESFALCRCGASGKKPFCDGSHRRIGFRSSSETSAA